MNNETLQANVLISSISHFRYRTSSEHFMQHFNWNVKMERLALQSATNWYNDSIPMEKQGKRKKMQ